MRIQEQLGADIIMQLDQCAPYPATREFVAEAVERSAGWGERCLVAHTRMPASVTPGLSRGLQTPQSHDSQQFFGIVQGGAYADLRAESVERIGGLDFDGFGIGGYSVGEPHELMFENLPDVAAALPVDKPRYLMGVGNPTTILEAIGACVDMFDCVLPTRTARMGTAFSSVGRMNLRNAQYAHDFGPFDPRCNCDTCTHSSRVYLRHLVTTKEMLGAILLSQHNLHYLLDLTAQARAAIEAGEYGAFLANWKASPAANDY